MTHSGNISRQKGIPKSEQGRANIIAALRANPPHKGHKHSAETKEKISRSSKERMSNPRYRDAVRFERTPEIREKLSIASIKAMKEGRLKPNQYYPHPYVTKSGKNITLRNSWEYKVAVYLDGLDCNWEFEQGWIHYNGKAYLPDFFIWDKEGDLLMLIEVKGWFGEVAKAKFYMFKDYLESLDVAVELFDRSVLEALNLL